MNLRDGIKHSCDVFFYQTALRVGIDRIEQTAHAMGLGKITGIELPGEKSGVIPGQAWKQKIYHQPWQLGETLNTGIGQGYVLVTPLQLCTQVARIASGKALSPRIAHMIGGVVEPRHAPQPLSVSDDALNKIRDGMNAVANEPGGTAYTWRITEPGLEMAGKTGTAQVRVITEEERQHGVKKDATLPWKLRDHGLFIGYAPVTEPRYACACIVEHNAPPHPQVQIARDVLVFAQQRGTLQLPTAYPVKAASAAQTL